MRQTKAERFTPSRGKHGRFPSAREVEFRGRGWLWRPILALALLAGIQPGQAIPPFRSYTPEWDYYETKDFAGKPYLLYFFRPLQPNRSRLITEQAAYLSQYVGEGGKVLGVVVDTPFGGLQEFIDRRKVTFPVVFSEPDEVLSNLVNQYLGGGQEDPVFLVVGGDGALAVSLENRGDYYLAVHLVREMADDGWGKASVEQMRGSLQAIGLQQFAKADALLAILGQQRPKSNSVKYTRARWFLAQGKESEGLRLLLEIYRSGETPIKSLIENEVQGLEKDPDADPDTVRAVDALLSRALLSGKEFIWLRTDLIWLKLLQLRAADALKLCEQEVTGSTGTPVDLPTRIHRILALFLLDKPAEGEKAYGELLSEERRQASEINIHVQTDFYALYLRAKKLKKILPTSFLFEAGTLTSSATPRQRDTARLLLEEAAKRDDPWGKKAKESLAQSFRPGR